MNNIQMAAKMYNTRDTAKRWYKEKYNEKIIPYKEILTGIMEDKNIEAIPALLVVSNTEIYNSDGMIQMLFISATCEIIEPS